MAVGSGQGFEETTLPKSGGIAEVPVGRRSTRPKDTNVVQIKLGSIATPTKAGFPNSTLK